jgi:hypothetical protein
MLYDLGRMQHLRELTEIAMVIAGIIATACFVCIALATSVRIVILIIDW